MPSCVQAIARGSSSSSLARAQAVPPAQRSLEVAAFVASAQLYVDVVELLPLTADGRAAVAPGPERERRLHLAILAVAHVHYLCPEPPPVLKTINPQMQAYFPATFRDRFIEQFGQAAGSSDPAVVEHFLCSSHGGSISGSNHGGSHSGGTHLAHLLCLYAESEQAAATATSDGLPDDQSMNARLISVAMKSSVVLLLQGSGFQQAVDAQLAALAGASELLPGQQLLTARQLAHVCGCQVAMSGGMMLVKKAAVQVAAVKFVQKVAYMCGEAVLQLEPNNPRGYFEAARFWDTAIELSPVQARDPLSPPQPPQRVVDAYLRAVSLGQQQGRDWWVARCAPPALLACGPAVSPASKAAAVAAVRQAQPALKRCKGLLPDYWIKSAECLLGQTPTKLARIEAELSAAQGQPGRSGASSATAGSPAVGYGRVVTVDEAVESMRVRSVQCSGCGSDALSLRRCSRCKQAQYCSVGCQKAHWLQHKLKCKPPG